MTSKQTPRFRVAPRLLSTVAVLTLGAWAQPAISATGTDARCDQPLDAPSMSIADNYTLPLQVVEHGAASTAAAEDIDLEDTAADPATKTATRPTGPRVDIMLRRIFDEARARQPSLAEQQHNGDLSAPLAVDNSENVDESAASLESDPVDSPAELPGFSADELHRYRQQMYRTDI